MNMVWLQVLCVLVGLPTVSADSFYTTNLEVMYDQNEKLERIANEMAMHFNDLATVCEKMTLELDNDMKQRNIDMRNNLLATVNTVSNAKNVEVKAAILPLRKIYRQLRDKLNGIGAGNPSRMMKIVDQNLPYYEDYIDDVPILDDTVESHPNTDSMTLAAFLRSHPESISVQELCGL